MAVNCALTENILRDTLFEVERDEANAINTLCAILEKVEQSGDFTCLPRVRSVMKDWQNRPPRAIVHQLAAVLEGLKNGVQG